MTAPIRLLAPFALAILAQAVAEPSAHADPGASTARGFDGTLPRPFTMSLRGATASEAWVTLEAQGSNTRDEGVLDLKSGCVVETMPQFTKLTQLLSPPRPDLFGVRTAADEHKRVETLMADSGTKAEIARFVTAGRRFGQRRLSVGTFSADGIAFSSDGKTIAIDANDTVFRSSDGGQTFDRLDANQGRFPAVTADGKWVLYERCSDATVFNHSCPEASREVRIVSSDNTTAARTIPLGSGLLRGMDPSGQKVVVVRYDMGSEVTVMHIDPAAGTQTRAFGIPSTVVKKNRFHDIDPSRNTGAFGVFDDNDVMPTNVITIVSMLDGKVTQKLTTAREMGTDVDDESGRILWQTYPDDHAWARRPGGSVHDLGMGDPLGWAPGGRALIFNAKYTAGRRASDAPATLGAVACKLVRVTTVQ